MEKFQRNPNHQPDSESLPEPGGSNPATGAGATGAGATGTEAVGATGSGGAGAGCSSVVPTAPKGTGSELGSLVQDRPSPGGEFLVADIAIETGDLQRLMEIVTDLFRDVF